MFSILHFAVELMTSVKTGKEQGRFCLGASGNPSGRPKGSRNKATIAAQALLDGEAEALTRKVIERAKEGDSVALRLCLERIVPPRKDRPVEFELPRIECCSDASKAIASIAAAVAAGDLTPDEGSSLAALVVSVVKMLDSRDLERRIDALEKQLETKRR